MSVNVKFKTRSAYISLNKIENIIYIEKIIHKMGDTENPKLINRQTDTVIEINSNPFSIGRGLSCNYVLPTKVVSRVHCILEKDENNRWTLSDTSTNGTYVNGKLIKGVKSPPLNNGATISLDLSDDSYIFQTTAPNHMEDISDEQLCIFAESVLEEVGIFQQSSQNQQTNNNLHANTAVNVDNASSAPATTSHALDRLGATKPDEGHLNKRRKTEVAASIAAITDHTRLVDLTQDNATASIGQVSEQTADKPGPSISTDRPPEGTSASGKSCGDAPQAEKMANEPQHDNFEVMENELQCAICSELFVKAVTLNCTHTFCKYCIEMWKKNKSECPICRARITGMTATLVLDNVIEKVIESSTEEIRQHRKQLLGERRKLEEPKPPPPAENQNTRGRGRGRGRGRAGRRADAPAGGGNYNVTINEDRTGDPVIEIVTDSDSNLDSDSHLDTDSDLDNSDWRDEYDDDDWYGDGVPGAYYGGYGHCFICGRRGHWANGCPYR